MHEKAITYIFSRGGFWKSVRCFQMQLKNIPNSCYICSFTCFFWFWGSFLMLRDASLKLILGVMKRLEIALYSDLLTFIYCAYLFSRAVFV